MNALANDGTSVLGWARRKNHPEVVTFLLSLGAIDRDGLIVQEEEDEEKVLRTSDDV